MSLMDDAMRTERALELEQSFSYDGYQIVRREMFAHLREPSVVIRRDSITFNTACIDGLEDTVYIQIMVNKDKHQMAIRRCDEHDKDALRWCIEKPDKRKSRKITSKGFSEKIYKLMNWSDKCRYKILGHRIMHDGEILYVFELDETEIFADNRRKKARKTDAEHAASPDQSNSQEQLTPEQIVEREAEEKRMARKPFYPDDWEHSFGVPVREHHNVSLDSIDAFGDMTAFTQEQKE